MEARDIDTTVTFSRTSPLVAAVASASGSSPSRVMPDWVIGVCFSVIASITINFGQTMMKYAHGHNANLRPSEQVFYLKQWRWIVGFVIFLGGNSLEFIALGFCAQSIIAPLGSLSLVSNAVMAPIFLREPLKRDHLVATAFIITGAVFTVVNGDHTESEYSLDDLMTMFGNRTLWAYWCFCVCAIFVVTVFIQRIQDEISGFTQRQQRRVISRLAPGDFNYRKLEAILPFLHVTVAGLIGAQTIIGAKSTAELLKSATLRSGHNAFLSLTTYVIIGCTVLSAVTQVHQFQLALQRGDALFVIPSFFVVWTTFSIIGGGIYFAEFVNFTAAQMFLFLVGIALTFTGVGVLLRMELGGGVSKRLTTITGSKAV